MNKRPCIYISLDGGLVQDVLYSNMPKPDFDVIVIDYDTEGADPDDLTDVDGDEAFVCKVDVNPATFEFRT